MLSPPNGHQLSPQSREPLHVIGMQGLGDNIFQRAFIKILSSQWDIHLETSWPELYADLPIKVVKPTAWTKLRTQAKNVQRSRAQWSPHPVRFRQSRQISYVRAFRNGRSIINGMEETFGVGFPDSDLDLPALPPSPVKSDKPIAFVRPVTVRKEWFNSARNPMPEYIAAVVDALRPTHHIVCVADLQDAAEWLVGPPVYADSNFIKGELPVMDMLALLAASDIVVGGVGWIVPASIALKCDAFIVLGGQALHNSPARILDQRLDCSRIGFATPKDFCQCSNMRHNCNKTIPDLMDQFSTFLKRRTPSRSCAGMMLSELVIIP